MKMINVNKRSGFFFTALIFFLVLLIGLVVRHVGKTITDIEEAPSIFSCTNCEDVVEYLIVDLTDSKYRFVVEAEEQYDRIVNQNSSKTQNIVLRKTPIGYWSIFEITQKQFESVMGYNPSYFKGKYYATRPVENVSRNEAARFVVKLCDQTGLALRLPSKDEWISACLAGGKDISSEEVCRYGRISINTPRSEELSANNDWKYYLSLGILEIWLQNMSPSYAGTQLVGRYLPNAWGLYDMHGNVREWTSTIERRDDIGILMGGACVSLPANCTATSEYPNGIDNLYSQALCGFRVCLDL